MHAMLPRMRAVSPPAWGLLLLLSLLAAPALAHAADVPVLDLEVRQRHGDLKLTVPTKRVAFADDDHDGRLSAPEVAAHRAALAAWVDGTLRLTAEQAVAPAAVRGAGTPPGETRGRSLLLLGYDWPGATPLRTVELRWLGFAPDTPDARCVAMVLIDGGFQDAALTPGAPAFEAGQPTPWYATGGRMITSGVEHILLGFDHVLFLISLLMLGGGLWYVVQVVTAFTVAHSITLSLAVLGYVRPPGSWIEPLIALTIVYVAAENFWRKDTRGRWVVTFLFGLVHGFGFAGALAESGLPPGNLAAVLAGFNLGVELGQLAVVLAASALLYAIRGWQHERRLRLAVSAGVVGMGLYWLLVRTIWA